MTRNTFLKVALITTTTWKGDKNVQKWMHSIFMPDALLYGVNEKGAKTLVLG